MPPSSGHVVEQFRRRERRVRCRSVARSAMPLQPAGASSSRDSRMTRRQTPASAQIRVCPCRAAPGLRSEAQESRKRASGARAAQRRRRRAAAWSAAYQDGGVPAAQQHAALGQLSRAPRALVLVAFSVRASSSAAARRLLQRVPRVAAPARWLPSSVNSPRPRDEREPVADEHLLDGLAVLLAEAARHEVRVRRPVLGAGSAGSAWPRPRRRSCSRGRRPA
jgi:hypothetical protein